MALTNELLGQIKGLTEDQIKGIVELSTNDEKINIKAAVSEATQRIHSGYDDDLEQILGIEKTPGVKTYEGMKKKLIEIKDKIDSSKYDEVSKKLEKAEAKVTKLEKELLDKSGDEALKQKLQTAQSQVEKLQADLDAAETAKKEEISKLSEQNLRLLGDQELNAASLGLTPREGLKAEDFQELLEVRRNRVYQKAKPKLDEDGRTIIWVDAKTGETLINPENKQNPFSGKELLSREIKDIVAEKRTGGGGGSSSQSGSEPGAGGGNASLDTSKFTSKIAADDEISRYLGAKGVLAGTPEWDEQALKLRDEYNVSALPFK